VKRILTHKLNVLSKSRPIKRFVFDLKDMSFSDSTALKALIGIIEDLEARGIRVCIVSPPRGLMLLMPHSRVSKKFRTVDLFDDMRELQQSGWVSQRGPQEVALKVQDAAPVSDLVLATLPPAKCVAPPPRAIVHFFSAPLCPAFAHGLPRSVSSHRLPDEEPRAGGGAEALRVAAGPC
jgi:anti-anti-sigma regulatory factor